MAGRELVEAVKDDARIPALVRLLEVFLTPTERGEAARVGMLELLHTSEEPFSRDYDLHHFTASALVLSDRGVLLHKHKRSGDWLQPGGHIDEGELPADAALREVVEETGIVAHYPQAGPVLLGLDVHITANNHVHYDLEYLLDADGAEPQPAPGESQEVGWFEIDRAIEMTDEACRNLIVTASDQRLR